LGFFFAYFWLVNWYQILRLALYVIGEWYISITNLAPRFFLMGSLLDFERPFWFCFEM